MSKYTSPTRSAGAQRAGHDAELDRAVAAEHERARGRRAAPPRPARRPRRAASRDGGGVLRAPVLAVGRPAPQRRVAEVGQRSARPASRSARGACSWPGACAPMLVGAPMRAVVVTAVKLTPVTTCVYEAIRAASMQRSSVRLPAAYVVDPRAQLATASLGDGSRSSPSTALTPSSPKSCPRAGPP